MKNLRVFRGDFLREVPVQEGDGAGIGGKGNAEGFRRQDLIGKGVPLQIVPLHLRADHDGVHALRVMMHGLGHPVDDGVIVIDKLD